MSSERERGRGGGRNEVNPLQGNKNRAKKTFMKFLALMLVAAIEKNGVIFNIAAIPFILTFLRNIFFASILFIHFLFLLLPFTHFQLFLW